MHKHKILIVDDEDYVRSALKRTLKMRGDVQVICAGNGDDAMKMLNTHEDVEVVISDQRMPGQAGVDFLSWVKKNYPDVVTIMLTGYAELEVALKAINDGMVFKFLTKPWEKEKLLSVIDAAIKLYHDLKEARRLLKERKEEARELLEELERKYPGITQIKRDEGGRIILEVE